MKTINTIKITTLSAAFVTAFFLSQSAMAYGNHEEGEVIQTTEHTHKMNSQAFKEQSTGNKEVGGGDTSHPHTRTNYLFDELDLNQELFPESER